MAANDFPEHLTTAHPEEAEKTKAPTPLTPRTVQHIHATLRVALAKAEKWDIVPRNIATLVGAPRVPHQQMRLFTPDQAQQFLGAWVWKKHPQQVLYHLPEVLENPIIFVVEGERDVETLRDYAL